MQLGFVSAILPDLSCEQVLDFAAEENFRCVELMCWPPGGAERRYAGITHVDVANLTDDDAAKIKEQFAAKDVGISGLGYYPNPLSGIKEESDVAVEHIKKVIEAAPRLGIDRVNTFIGREPKQSPNENWERFFEIWPDIIKHAEGQGVYVGIENCPMYFTKDEWPSGKNLASSPAAWRRMFDLIPSDHFGLNYDPSHLVWQMMDPVAPMKEFADRIFHVHAKDVAIDYEALGDVGVLAYPLEYHRPKLPGLGEVPWGEFFNVLGETGYRGPVCIEVEDRVYEGTLAGRKEALRQSARFLRNYMPASDI